MIFYFLYDYSDILTLLLPAERYIVLCKIHKMSIDSDSFQVHFELAVKGLNVSDY